MFVIVQDQRDNKKSIAESYKIRCWCNYVIKSDDLILFDFPIVSVDLFWTLKRVKSSLSFFLTTEN